MQNEDEQHKQQLIERYINGKATEKELMAFFGLIHRRELDDLLSQSMEADFEAARMEAFNTQKRRKTGRWWVAAASILFILSAGGYFVVHRQVPNNQVALLKPGTFKNDVLPGDKAFLTLSNGKKIAVSSAKAGSLAQQGLVNIQKSGGGDIVYQPAQASNSSAEVVYNTFTTLRGGGKHALTLADGTLAILDAGSSITYPVTFMGKERQVKITGQVYFEVTHSAAMPFSVLVKNQVIRDLGTNFNINAYDDEGDVKTTLLEGSIAISSDKNKGYTLKPGQQAVAAPDGSIRIKENVDLGVVVAWKNDLFKFDSHTSLPAVMRQLSRWYDLDVAYEGEKKHYNFGGDIPRNSKLSDVLKILEYSGVQFAVDGKKIIVFQ